MTITIKFGGETHTMTSINEPTVRDIISNSTAKAVLGYPDNVRALVDGVEMTNDTRLPDGTTVRLETRANQKAN